MEKSAFDTLEALGDYLAKAITREFKPNPKELVAGEEGWQMIISMAKPTAVPFAENPIVEMRVAAVP